MRLFGMSDQTRYRPAAKYAGPSAHRQPVQSFSTWTLPRMMRLKRSSRTVKEAVSMTLLRVQSKAAGSLQARSCVVPAGSRKPGSERRLAGAGDRARLQVITKQDR